MSVVYVNLKTNTYVDTKKIIVRDLTAKEQLFYTKKIKLGKVKCK